MNIETLSFTTKDEYLQWRAEWRAAYKQLSQDIRDQRWQRAMDSRISAKSVHSEALYWQLTPDKRREYDAQITNQVVGTQIERFKAIRYQSVEAMSAKARVMLELRKQSKIEAQRQYLAERAATTPSCAAETQLTR